MPTSYDPDKPMDGSEWLKLPETERLRLAASHHVAARIKTAGMKAHAALHVVVENQFALGYGPSKRAVVRLQAQGLSRHEAIHAIGAVVARFMGELGAQTEEERMSYQSRMGTAIEQLNARPSDLSASH